MLTIYKASAGSGKTYTLAQDYIRLLLGVKNEQQGYRLNLTDTQPRRSIVDNRHRFILAITFTRKATEEMKSRILHELDILSSPDKKSPYQGDFMEMFGCSRQDLALASSMALRQILFDYHNFNVSTIDAFFQRVLHTFARELDRQSDYNIELNDQAAMKSAVGAMLDEFNAQGAPGSPLENWLMHFMTTKIEEGNKANFFNRNSKLHTDLVRLIANISKESFKPYSAALKQYLDDGKLPKFALAVGNLRKTILDQMQTVAKSLLQTVDIGLFKLKACHDVLDAALNHRSVNSVEAIFGKSKTMADILGDAPEAGFYKNKGTAEQTMLAKEFFRFAHAQYSRYVSLKPLDDSITQLGLLAHAWNYLIRFVEENNTLLISDTNELVHRIIDHDDTPFIYERMGVRLSHFLIDEFQDTSKMQWDNLRPLVGNGLSGGNDSLVIGDEKQSIYRFRNSDSSILHTQVGNDFAPYLDPDSGTDQRSTNFRSSADVVRFNNSLFSVLAENTRVEGFENVVQRIRPDYLDYRGYIRFVPISSIKNKEGQGDATEILLDAVAQEIMRQMIDGKYRGRDIAVLVNTNAEATKVVDFLLRNYMGLIPVLSDEALRITSSSAVQLVVSVMRLIDNQQSSRLSQDETRSQYLSKEEVAMTLNRFEFFLTTDLDALASTGVLPMPEDVNRLAITALQKAVAPEGDSHQGISVSLQSIRDRKPATLPALVETIIGVLISEAERRDQFAFLSTFQDLVVEYAYRTDGSLHSFLDWWDTNGVKKTIAGTSDEDAVRVMTIHKSKGLEFDCVLMPFCTWPHHWASTRAPEIWTPLPSIDGIDPTLVPPVVYVKLDSTTSCAESPFNGVYNSEYKRSIVDTMNKTYVAFTRARSELIVWYDNKESSIGSLIENAFVTGLSTSQETPQLVTEGLIFNLSDYYDKATGDFCLGEPTLCRRCDEDEAEPVAVGSNVMGIDKEPYPVNFRTEHTDAIMRLDDVLDLDNDIDDAREVTTKSRKAFDTEARDEGNILHDIMQRVYVASDLHRAAATVAARRNIDNEQIKSYEHVISRFLDSDDERIKRWFADYVKVYIEQPIYVPNGNFVRRPDRVIVNADGSTDVIDYKFTDDIDNVGTEDQKEQVREYVGLLRDLGYNHVSGYLCYPRLNTIIKI